MVRLLALLNISVILFNQLWINEVSFEIVSLLIEQQQFVNEFLES